MIFTRVDQYEIVVNILYGNIDQIQDTSFGMLIIECMGAKANCQRAVEYLQKQGLRIEVLKNV